MIFAQFWGPSALDRNKLIEACGDQGVVIIDGRLSAQSIAHIAEEVCRKRGYKAWQIHKGESFTRSRPVSQVNYLHDNNTHKNPVWLRAHGM